MARQKAGPLTIKISIGLAIWQLLSACQPFGQTNQILLVPDSQVLSRPKEELGVAASQPNTTSPS